ncbi:MAG: translocation/assembly module TamB domain-containing protein [Candidatus Marinimicrobia bacterium]|nr:translocation/assembly module TamB domain-containing protein [Candidatus Neomarinimicrobiota bacterium]
MHRKKFIAVIILTLFLILIIGAVLIVIFEPSLWVDEIVAYINTRILEKNGWVLTTGELQGPLTSSVEIDDVWLKKLDGSVDIYCKKMMLNLDIQKVLVGQWAVSTCQIDNAWIKTKPPAYEKTLDEMIFVKTLIDKEFHINELMVNNLTIFQGEENLNLYTINFEGSLKTSDVALIFSPCEIDLSRRFGMNQDYHLSANRIEITSIGIVIDDAEGMIDDIHFFGNMMISIVPEFRLNMDAQIKSFPYQQYVTQDISKIIKAETVDLDVKINSDLIQTEMEGTIIDGETKSKIAQFLFDLYREENSITLTKSTIDLGYCSLSGKGSLISNRQLTLQVNLDKFDLGDIKTSLSSNFSGSIIIEGELDGTHIDALTVNLNLTGEIPEFDYPINIYGNLEYTDKILSIVDSLQVEVEGGGVTVSGYFNLEKEWMALNLRVEDDTMRWMSWVTGVDSLGGKIEGIVKIDGYWKNPSLSGYLTLMDGNILSGNIGSLSSSFRISSVLSKRMGAIKLIMNQGEYAHQVISKGIIDIYLEGDTVHIGNCRLENNEDYCVLSGKLINNNQFVMDQFQLFYKGQYITSMDQFSIFKEGSQIWTEPNLFQVNEGTVDASITVSDGSLESVELKASNLELSSLRTVLNVDYPLAGRMFGYFSVSNREGKIEGNGELVLKSGYWKEIEFDDFQVTASLKDSVLFFDEVSFLGIDQSLFRFNGYVTVLNDESRHGLTVSPGGEISIASEVRNFNLSKLSEYYPESWSIRGRASGSLVMSGTAKSPEAVYDFVILKPGFSRLVGRKITGRGRYIDRRLYFEDLEGNTDTGNYWGEGYLPWDLALSGTRSSRFPEHDPVSLHFSAKTRSIDFLTPYLTSVDSITGDIQIELDITGTPKKPIRNGSFIIKDGTIYAFLLDQAITNVNGKAILTDNKFIIDELWSESHPPIDSHWVEKLKSNISDLSGGVFFKRRSQEEDFNIKITGSMDMTKFFEPNMAYLITGKNVYIRTLLGEIEGIVDLELSVTGKDTMNIKGDIIPHEAVLRMEFAGRGDYDKVPRRGRVIPRYQLHFPISGNLYLRNSQVDAELDGNMSMFKTGSEPYQFSGELNVVKGKFYYYSDVFDIHEGYLSFDPTEFNPQLDIRASTEISGVEINVYLIGDLKEPTVIIEDSEQFYSQSDLLQLLTIQKRLEEQDITSEGLKDQSINVFGLILENEFEKNFGRISGFDTFEIEGTSTLLSKSKDSDLSVELGKRVSNSLYLSYKRSFSLTDPDQVGIEYRVNRNISFIGSYDEEGQVYLKYRLKYQY